MLNENHFSQLEQMMGDTLLKLVASYINSSDLLIQEMSEAIHQKDANKLMHSAHPMKSASRQVGAIELGDMLEKLESAGRERKLDGVEALYTQANEEYAAIKAQLQRKMLPL
jgi:HPt (histidine-containing phosphotransfer) domain-containing protein